MPGGSAMTLVGQVYAAGAPSTQSTYVLANAQSTSPPEGLKKIVQANGDPAILDMLNAVRQMSERGKCDVHWSAVEVYCSIWLTRPDGNELHQLEFQCGPIAAYVNHAVPNKYADCYTDISKAVAKIVNYAKSDKCSDWRDTGAHAIYRHQSKEWQVWID